jgi:hypothetical protein
VGWSIPREWEGETAVIYGGGPSLSRADVDYAKTRFRRIACNDAFLLDPECDVLCWCDARWFLWNKHELRQHTGKYKIAWRHVPQISGTTIHLLVQEKDARSLSVDPRKVVANNTGQGAINLAYLFGAKRILLLGFDMKPVQGQANWHTRHREPSDSARLKSVFAPAIAKTAEMLKAEGVEVINCTRGSALTCFPIADIRDV